MVEKVALNDQQTKADSMQVGKRLSATHCVDCGQQIMSKFWNRKRCRPCQNKHTTLINKIRDAGMSTKEYL